MANYILKNKVPVKVDEISEWATWFEKNDRIIKQTKFGEVLVSTVFLGIDHNFIRNSNKKPVLFETMIFGGKHDLFQERYITYQEAEVGHEKACEMIVRENIAAINSNDEDICTCDKGESDEHACPYKSEIAGDEETMCSCCQFCMYQCTRDI